jgi:hypothetical protein
VASASDTTNILVAWGRGTKAASGRLNSKVAEAVESVAAKAVAPGPTNRSEELEYAG